MTKACISFISFAIAVFPNLGRFKEEGYSYLNLIFSLKPGLLPRSMLDALILLERIGWLPHPL